MYFIDVLDQDKAQKQTRMCESSVVTKELNPSFPFLGLFTKCSARTMDGLNYA